MINQIIPTMVFKKAEIDDIDILILLRMELIFQINDIKVIDIESKEVKINDIKPEFDVKDFSTKDFNTNDFEQKTRDYFKQYIEKDEQTTFICYIEGNPAGCGSICFQTVMPTFDHPTGRRAHIMNVYTRAESRRMGIAYHILDLLVREAARKEVTQITLEATDEGKSLYEKYGFSYMKNGMEWC